MGNWILENFYTRGSINFMEAFLGIFLVICRLLFTLLTIIQQFLELTRSK